MPLVTVLSASVVLSVAVSRPVPIKVVDASVMVLGSSLVDVGGATSDEVWVPVITTIPSSEVDEDEEEELDVVESAFSSSFAACARMPKLRSTKLQSLKGAICGVRVVRSHNRDTLSCARLWRNLQSRKLSSLKSLNLQADKPWTLATRWWIQVRLFPVCRSRKSRMWLVLICWVMTMVMMIDNKRR